MLDAREIIVVAPEQYKDLGRKLTHEISKLPGFNGAFYTIKQYEDNEFQLGSNRYVILMGNSDENPVTRDFLPVIETLNNQAGACFGFDGTKAVVFGEGKLKQEKEFKKVLSRSVAIAAGVGALSTVGATLAAASIVFLPIEWILLPVYFIYVLAWRKARERKLRTEQTKAALTLFLAEHFDAWVGLKN